jgi:hypothetical protein
MESNIKRLSYLLIGLGIIFGLETYLEIRIIYKLWPLLILSLGAGFIAVFFKREKREPLYIGIGIYLLCFSILSFICNFTTWHNIKFLWPLFILFLSISYFVIYYFNKHKTFLFLGFLFLSISIIFFMLFLSYKLWWTIFIFLGISILITEKK